MALFDNMLHAKKQFWHKKSSWQIFLILPAESHV